MSGWPNDRYGPGPTPAAEAARAHEAELQRIADETGETLETVRDLADAMACCAAEGGDEARVDRFERARDAAFDALGAAEAQVPNIDEAISTAVRVRVDGEVLAAALDAYDRDMIDSSTNVYATICAAFRAAGFEVEQ